MTVSWKDLEGTALAEDFQLQNLLFDKGTTACFLARRSGELRPAGWLWLMLGDGTSDVLQLQRWRAAAGLSHPNLVQVRETGRTQRDDAPMVYLLAEPAEENLAAVLGQRPLNQVEARETLLCAAKALSYLHGRGLVHGNMEPAAILAVGEAIKLSSDSIAPSAANGGVLSAADDLRALGASIHAMFTQNPEPDLERLYAIPQPFRDIIRGCCGVADEAWTAQRVVAALEWAPEAAAPSPEVPEPEAEPEPEPPPPPAKRRRLPAWVFVTAVTGAALLFAALVRKPQPTVPSSPQPLAPATSAGEAPKPAPPAPLPSALGPPAAKPSPEPSGAVSSRIWRVVIYTYSNPDAATRRANEVNRKWPQLRAEPFFPKGSSPPYYVALGGRMTRSEAQRLRERAISHGLPRDTFVRNFSK